MIPKPQNVWRIELAQKLFQKVKTTKGLQTAFIGGSVCRGLADEYSDLELCFVWDTLLEEKQRLAFNETLEVKSFYVSEQRENDFKQVEESVHFHDFQIDIFHTTTAYINSIIEAVFVKNEIKFSQQIYLNVLHNALPLYDNGRLEEWKNQIETYPQRLGTKLIQTYTDRFFKASVDIFLYRKDWAVFYSLITGYQKNIFLVLTALNKVYFSGFKYSHQHIQQFSIKPQGMSDLYEKLYQLPPIEMWESIKKLKLEVLQLVKKYYPEIETTHIFQRLNTGRKKFVKPPIETT